MTRYENELRWLYSLESRGARLGLDRIRTGLRVRDNPQKALCCVHIAGTNGKGSVAAMLESVFRHAGYLTGQFCSPHLHRYVERVQVGGARSPKHLPQQNWPNTETTNDWRV